MQNIIKNKKAGMTLSILLLVLMTLALVITTLGVFNARAKNLQLEASSDYRTLDDFYAKESAMEFYMSSLAKSIIADNPSINPQIFPLEFMRLFNGAIYQDYLGKISPDKITARLENNKLIVEITDFEFSQTSGFTGNQKVASIRYTKNLEFEVQL